MTAKNDLERLRDEALAQLRQAVSSDALETWRIRYLGAKGAVKSAMSRLKEIAAEQRAEYGKLANQVKDSLAEAFEDAKGRLAAPKPRQAAVDITLPGEPLRVGHQHILTQTIAEITDICGRMGFTVAYGPEVEDEWHNFNALNIPPSHPARDELDNFYISPSVMLRSQTSTVQIRVMETRQPPIRIVAPGRVYRPDTVDARHSFMFHQLEGLYVDEGVTMSDLKSCLDQFCEAYFGPEVRTRLRPSFFPFTEPSAELDVLFTFADGRTAWVELGGCGMVDPNVLKAVNYDAEKYTGFAFGLGIERLAMRKHGIPDIRLLFESDVRFLRQF